MLFAMESKSEQISDQMRRMPTRDSKPEIKIRKVLYSLGLRYRVHQKHLPGKPDISFGPAKVAVFVDGCFWHNCPDHGTIPKSNRDWWVEKFKKNRERDKRKDRELRQIGWEPIHIWEHEDPEEASKYIARVVSQRTP
tara:strand:- start:2577 stop:2990 length:414 start_codon:yes stop_codon:yes gene_type:complete